MRRFIYGERGGIYIIDLLQDRGAARSRRRSSPPTLAHRGGTVLFVGTKKQARDTIKEVAEAADMPYVNHRWLGGLLTNFQTISLRIKRLHDLERYEAEGQLALLPTRERMAAQADLAKLRANLGGVKNMQRSPDAMFVIDLKTEEIAVKRGAAPAHPDHRAGRHQLRPRRHRLRDPRQRRRDPLVRADHAGDRRRRGRGPRGVPRRGGARAQGGRGEGPHRGRGARRARGRGAGRARPRSSRARGRPARRSRRRAQAAARPPAPRRRRSARRAGRRPRRPRQPAQPRRRRARRSRADRQPERARGAPAKPSPPSPRQPRPEPPGRAPTGRRRRAAADDARRTTTTEAETDA